MYLAFYNDKIMLILSRGKIGTILIVNKLQKEHCLRYCTLKNISHHAIYIQ